LPGVKEAGHGTAHGAATSLHVESLLRRGRDTDVDEANAALGTPAAVPTDPSFVLCDLASLRMRGLVALACDDEVRTGRYVLESEPSGSTA